MQNKFIGTESPDLETVTTAQNHGIGTFDMLTVVRQSLDSETHLHIFHWHWTMDTDLNFFLILQALGLNQGRVEFLKAI